ncbi:MAG: hypothetical protein AB2385_12820 [Symbiobacterium sp.]|uniref:hypothetical protein n=1 Tax=Symbiobacterium sp. TaxID=1971213 RepID=UPI0034643E0F
MDEIDLKRVYSYNFRFVELHNGLPVEGRQMYVEVSARTGQVSYYYTYSEDVSNEEFPAAEGVISVDQAVEAHLDAIGLRPAWVRLWNWDNGQRKPPQLLWSSDNRLPLTAIDAFTGAPLDWQGRDLIAATRRPTDIAGHFAEREIELLWSRGVLDLDDGKTRWRQGLPTKDGPVGGRGDVDAQPPR